MMAGMGHSASALCPSVVLQFEAVSADERASKMAIVERNWIKTRGMHVIMLCEMSGIPPIVMSVMGVMGVMGVMPSPTSAMRP